MGKTKIGSINHQNIVKGDANLLKQGELLVSNSEGYTIIRKRESSGKIKTFVVIPLEEFDINKASEDDKRISSETEFKTASYSKKKNNRKNGNTTKEDIKRD